MSLWGYEMPGEWNKVSAVHWLWMTQKLPYNMLGTNPYESDTEGMLTSWQWLQRLVLCFKGMLDRCAKYGCMTNCKNQLMFLPESKITQKHLEVNDRKSYVLSQITSIKMRYL